MAIEFNCPYCTATSRVPDAYAGKQGRCPKCDTKILIPNVPMPVQPAEEEQTAAAPPQPAVVFIADVPSVSGSLPVVPPGLPPVIGAVEDPFAVRPVTTVAKPRRRNTRRRPSRALVIGVPVICFLILFGIIAYSLIDILPHLHGELLGRRMDGLTLPKSMIPWTEITLSGENCKILQEALSTQPESLTSQIIVCRLSANDDGIIVTLAAQPESQWIVVDVSSEKPLAIWR